MKKRVAVSCYEFQIVGLERSKRGLRGRPTARKESDRARGTHQLESESGGTSQETERIRSSEGHSQTEDSIGRDKSGYEMDPTEQGNSPTGVGIGRDKSGHGKDPTERGALTCWRRHREGQVRTQKESD